MNAVKRWLERRRNRRRSDEISEQQHKEAIAQSKRACLSGAFDEIEASLEKIGFKCCENRTRDDEYKNATTIAIGPDTQVYRLMVFAKGGYRLEKL